LACAGGTNRIESTFVQSWAAKALYMRRPDDVEELFESNGRRFSEIELGDLDYAECLTEIICSKIFNIW